MTSCFEIRVQRLQRIKNVVAGQKQTTFHTSQLSLTDIVLTSTQQHDRHSAQQYFWLPPSNKTRMFIPTEDIT